MSNANQPAFPLPPAEGASGPLPNGLSKREYFALHIMCALRSQVNPESGDDCYTREYAAKAAVGDADALLALLAQ